MTERDRRIGNAVVALRGGKAQSAVADEMRERGWKWSQATVWSVEKGERPLRLLEAADLADVLGVQIEDFFGDRAEVLLDAKIRDLSRYISEQARQIRTSTQQMIAAQDRLRQLAEEAGITVPSSHEEAKNYASDSHEQLLHLMLEHLTPEYAVQWVRRSYPKLKDKEVILRDFDESTTGTAGGRG